MKLHTLELTNFKGQKYVFMDFEGHNAKVYGDNATGKTTLEDAFIWLLTGKDHLGRSDLSFNIKTLDVDGNAIPMLDHMVRATLEHEGMTFELIRNFKEVWQKKTGSNVQTFTGHKTEYFIDGVPKSEKEYNAFIERLVPSQLLKLLIMPGYFNEQLKAEDRRKMLLDMCGDVDEAELLALPQYAVLAEHVTKLMSVADLKKAKAAQKTKLNEEIKAIPIQINVHAQYQNVGSIKPEVEVAAIKALNDKINTLSAERSGLYNGESISQLRKELAELETEQAKAEAAAMREVNEKRRQLSDNLSRAQDNQANILRKINNLEHTRETLIREIESFKSSKEKALDQYYTTEESEFAGDTTCPTCGQDFPPEHMEQARAVFNKQKAQTLERIVDEGKKLAAIIEAKEAEAWKAAGEIGNLKRDLKYADDIIRSYNAELEELRTSSSTPFDNSCILAKRAEIERFNDSVSERDSELGALIASLSEQKAIHERNIIAYKHAENSAKEIEVLKAREKELAAQYEECEGIIALCDDFTNARVLMLDEKISGYFRYARFKLTETLVNGGLREICDTLVDGVPYSAANNAARINIGLDIIEAFSRHYGISLPVFVDNAESVTALEHIDAQVIQLIVSEQDKTLRLDVS